MLFVLPRAADFWLPRRRSWKKQPGHRLPIAFSRPWKKQPGHRLPVVFFPDDAGKSNRDTDFWLLCILVDIVSTNIVSFSFVFGSDFQVSG